MTSKKILDGLSITNLTFIIASFLFILPHKLKVKNSRNLGEFAKVLFYIGVLLLSIQVLLSTGESH